MKKKIAERGDVCISLQGRDAGQIYAVVGVTPGYVYLADGQYKKLDGPKKKNIKHVRLMNISLTKTQILNDGEIYRALRAIRSRKTEDDECQKAT